MATAKASAGKTHGAASSGGSVGESPDSALEAPAQPRERPTKESVRTPRQKRAPPPTKQQAPREAANSIRPTATRARSAREDGRSQSEDVRAVTSQRRERDEEPLQAPRTPLQPKEEGDPWTVPLSVRDRFQQDGHRFYFPDGKPAFRDHGRRLTTVSENTVVIASLIEIARARGWESITVRGTERFRAEAWKQGKLAGLEVRGYKANESERVALIRTMARREERAREERESAGEAAEPPRVARGASARGEPGRLPPEGLFVGKLLEHGIDRYQFNPKADYSYFVRIETCEGKRVIWGTDFERALKESLSQPQIGDEVVLRHRGTAPVTVRRRERDETGKVVNEELIGARRNTWMIEKRDFLESRAAAAELVRDPATVPRHVVKDHPELAGTLLNLRAAQIAAKAKIRDPEDREKFVSIIRNALADSVARGDPLQPVRLRAPGTRPERRAPEREQALTH